MLEERLILSISYVVIAALLLVFCFYTNFTKKVKLISIFTWLSVNSSQLLDRIEEVSYPRSFRTSNAQGLITPLGFEPHENPCIVSLKKLLHSPSESMERAEL